VALTGSSVPGRVAAIDTTSRGPPYGHDHWTSSRAGSVDYVLFRDLAPLGVVTLTTSPSWAATWPCERNGVLDAICFDRPVR
jgi:hypothetical protein